MPHTRGPFRKLNTLKVLDEIPIERTKSLAGIYNWEVDDCNRVRKNNIQPCADPGIFIRGGGGPGQPNKKALTTFFFFIFYFYFFF